MATESDIWHRWIVLDLSRWQQGLSLHKHLLLWYLKSVTVTSTVSYIWYDDMPAHRRDTSGETAQQNHRKEAHLKANCGRSLTRTTQQRQRRNEHEHDEGRRKTEVLESGRISSARFSIFWKNVSATIYILPVWPGADVSAYFHVHRYHFWLSKISFFNSVFARSVKLIYQRFKLVI